MTDSVSSIIISEGGERTFTHNPTRGEYGDTAGSDIRAFERRMQQGGLAISFIRAVPLRSGGSRVTETLLMPSVGYIMVYDFMNTRMCAVDASVYVNARPGDVIDPEIALAELDSDNPRATEPVGTSTDEQLRYGKPDNAVFIEWITQHNERFGPKNLLAGWDNHGNPMPMDTPAQRAAQKAEAAIYIARISGQEQGPSQSEPLQASEIPIQEHYPTQASPDSN